LGTVTVNGKELSLERWDIEGITIPPGCIALSQRVTGRLRELLELKFQAVKAALRSKSKDLQDEAVDAILGDLVEGAYQDKLVIYSAVPTDSSLEGLRGCQKARQAADRHLLNIIKAVRDMKRPPVNVVVKQADQVNVAEQINQGEQQVNIGKHQEANIHADKQPA
jgi:hypothetical protein